MEASQGRQMLQAHFGTIYNFDQKISNNPNAPRKYDVSKEIRNGNKLLHTQLRETQRAISYYTDPKRGPLNIYDELKHELSDVEREKVLNGVDDPETIEEIKRLYAALNTLLDGVANDDKYRSLPRGGHFWYQAPYLPKEEETPDVPVPQLTSTQQTPTQDMQMLRLLQHVRSLRKPWEQRQQEMNEKSRKRAERRKEIQRLKEMLKNL